jgi:hypothetical protein
MARCAWPGGGLRSIYFRAAWAASTLAMFAASCGSVLAAPARTPSRASLVLAQGGRHRKPLRLTLRADRLRYRACPAKRAVAASQPACRPRLELSGKVAISGKRITLRAKLVTASLDHKGRIATIAASGGVGLEVGRRRGGAARATLDARRRRLQLVGGAHLRCPGLGLQLRGKRISLDLSGRHLEVDDVRAELALPSRRAKAKGQRAPRGRR